MDYHRDLRLFLLRFFLFLRCVTANEEYCSWRSVRYENVGKGKVIYAFMFFDFCEVNGFGINFC